ncbi:glycosyl hydrolase-related protein [Actinomadura verrucosospora]
MTVSAASVFVEAVKLAEDRSGDVVIRVYEASGARPRTTVRLDFAFEAAWLADLLERALGQGTGHAQETIELDLRPFEIATLRGSRRR